MTDPDDIMVTFRKLPCKMQEWTQLTTRIIPQYKAHTNSALFRSEENKNKWMAPHIDCDIAYGWFCVIKGSCCSIWVQLFSHNAVRKPLFLLFLSLRDIKCDASLAWISNFHHGEEILLRLLWPVLSGQHAQQEETSEWCSASPS